MKKRFFDDLWEYVKDGEISNYRWTGVVKRDKKEVVIHEIDILEDPMLVIRPDEELEKDGKIYIPIDWGEGENNYILETEITRYAGRFWTIAYWEDKNTLRSYGEIYQTEEDAIEDAKEWHEADEDEIWVRKI
ncbi:MAG: hypothetical protein ACOC1K_06220 [Nanoarchaeota archaeon]